MNFWQAAFGIVTGTASYEAFLPIIAYWIGPWLGVMFADQYLRRGQAVSGILYDRSSTNWPGLVSFLIGLVVSVLLFSNPQRFVGFLARMFPQFGDITFFAGFLIAGGCYLLFARSAVRSVVAPNHAVGARD